MHNEVQSYIDKKNKTKQKKQKNKKNYIYIFIFIQDNPVSVMTLVSIGGPVS